MSKKVLVIKGSPRKNGNTSTMADAWIKGAMGSGNEVTEGGILFAYGTNGPADVKEMSALEEAYQMGKTV